MAVKWLNGLVVLIFVLILGVNKEYFFSRDEISVKVLPERSEMSTTYIERQSLNYGLNTVSADANGDVVEESHAEVEESAVEDVRTYIFGISKGMGSKEVSFMLYELGLTKSEMEFSEFLESKGYAKVIQVGTFKITGDMSFEDIAKLITAK